MKTLKIILLSLFNAFFSSFLFAEKMPEQCDYIKSGYYQNIYKAEIELLKGNSRKAYKYYLQAEEKCEMIQSMGYYEIYNFVTLLLKYGDYAKALHYIDYLITYKGYGIADFSDLPTYQKLSSQITNWENTLSLLQEKEKNFVSDTLLAERFEKMEIRDQYYRSEMIQCYIPYTDTLDTEFKNRQIKRDSLAYLCKILDDSNYFEFLDIINNYGFPFEKHKKISTYHQSIIYASLGLLFVHIDDTTRTKDLEPVLLNLITNGNCPPLLYAIIIDRQKFLEKKAFIYGLYKNKKNQAYNMEDPKNIDKRRMDIGLPTLKMEKKRQKLLYGF